MKVFIKISIVLILILGLLACSNISISHGGGSEGEMAIIGIMVDKNDIPVQNAHVRLFITSDTSITVDSVYTDSIGSYSFKNIETGTYTIKAIYTPEIPDMDTLSALVENIEYTAETLYNVGVQTMLAPGYIRGVVTLADNNNSSVTCYIPGTSYQAKSDSNGAFIISNVPQGTYSIVFEKLLFFPEVINDVKVYSDSITVINPVTLERDTTLEPPVVTDCEALYDTLTGLAYITWHSVKVADLAGYYLYIKVPESDSPTLISTKMINDTFYVDSLWNRVHNKNDRSIIYQLKAVDNSNNLSSLFSNPDTIVALSGPIAYYDKHIQATLLGDITQVSKIVMTSYYSEDAELTDTIEFVPSIGSTPSINQQIPVGDTIHHIETKILGNTNNLIGYKYWAIENHEKDTVVLPGFNVNNAKPYLRISTLPKSVYASGDSIDVTFTAIDSFGGTLQYKYYFNKKTSYDCDSGLIPLRLPSETGEYTLIVEAIDNDLNIASDSTTIIIDNQIVAYWDFDSTTDTLWDKSGNELHGIIEGTTVVEGISGAALYFNYNSKSSVRIKKSPLLEALSNRTISIWVKADSIQVNENVMLLRKCASRGNGYSIHWQRDEGKMTFDLDYRNVRLTAPDLSNLYAGKWTHIVTVEKDSVVELYRNGTLIASGIRSKELTHSDDLYIGGNTYDAFECFFNGIIDEVIIYKSALSKDEVLSLYSQQENFH